MNMGERIKSNRWRIVWGLFLLCAVAVKSPHPSLRTFIGSAAEAETGAVVFTLDGIEYQEVMWDALIPEDFTADQIMAKYQDKLAEIEDGTPEADSLYAKMLEEYNNAPANEKLDGTMIRLPGFIAPLELSDEIVTDFLLVPYFGACIHMPPPPANQTVLVKTAEGYGIEAENAYYPIWIMGKMKTEKKSTELAEAGYYMTEAMIEPYSE